ncbi:MAG: DUF3014 domain-containing protein [Casimicrobiaceae bacterium]
MKSPLRWLLPVAAFALGAGLYYYYWRGTHPPEPPPPPVAAAEPAPKPLEAPRILHPVPETPPPAAPLPPLASSDALITETVSGMFGREAYARFFYPDGLLRRFVATVDNLPRKSAAARLMPVKPVPGTFVVTGNEKGFEIGAENALRYRPYVVAMEAVEARRLVAAYVRLYPLFQSAYEELGYPNGYFNDRLVQAIDDLLAAPDIAAPALVVQPKVLYEYADADLEERSAGQKMMLRMGTGNAARVKDKLRAIRRELTGRLTTP